MPEFASGLLVGAGLSSEMTNDPQNAITLAAVVGANCTLLVVDSLRDSLRIDLNRAYSGIKDFLVAVGMPVITVCATSYLGSN